MRKVAIGCAVFFSSLFGFAQISELNHATELIESGNNNSTASNLFLHLNTDCWPEETTWILENSQGEILHEGGPYYNQSLTEITEEFWMETGIYTFTFYDAAGDGLYATQWGELCDENGSFELVDAGGNVLLQDDGTANFDSLSVTFDFNAAVSVSENDPVSSIRTFPNPFNDQLWVNIRLLQPERTSIEVFSLDGKLQHRFEATLLPAGNSDVQLGLEHLETGSYLLRIAAGSQSETRRIVKLN